MKLIIDTNVLIALEPTSTEQVEAGLSPAANLVRIASEGRHQIYIHPIVDVDIANDPDEARRSTRQGLLKKYPALPDPPALTPDIKAACGHPTSGTNDWVDAHLLAAIQADAADYLVTEDQPLRRTAQRLGLGQRVVSVDEATQVLYGLFDIVPVPPPAVRAVKAHVLDGKDPIFDSLRADYVGFDDWLAKCKRKHRPAWIVSGPEQHLEAVVIVNIEDSSEYFSGRALKICTLKVAEDQLGRRLGELLLKTVFNYARTNKLWSLYVTVFKKHVALVELLEDFGFSTDGTTAKAGDLVFRKRMAPSDDESATLDALEFHRQLGPYALRLVNVPLYVVPIKPVYHRLLFPDLEPQQLLLAGRHPFGNSIRKAYLCHSGIRQLEPGAALMFYRSRQSPGVTCLGVLEDTLVSSSPEEVARFVGKRTVYAFDEIKQMCKSEVLAILFRQSRPIKPILKLHELKKNGALAGAPQSITSIRKESLTWLRGHLSASR